jgi:hypothetical protein
MQRLKNEKMSVWNWKARMLYAKIPQHFNSSLSEDEKASVKLNDKSKLNRKEKGEHA